MNDHDLEHQSEESLEELLNKTATLLKQKQETRRRTAIEQINAIAAEAKITVTIKGEKRSPQTKELGEDSAADKTYQHPDKPELTWNGSGQPPKWLKTLIKSGRDKSEFEVRQQLESSEAHE